MTADDRRRWDRRHAGARPAAPDEVTAPVALAPYEHLLPVAGGALDLACGTGEGAVWLARRGLHVVGLDVSPVAIGLARELARGAGVDGRCRFVVHDLDDGLPPGPTVDVVLCHRFRDPRLDAAIVERVHPGGVVLLVALSEVGGAPGPFRARPGELRAAFGRLDVLAHDERDGTAVLVARRP